MENKPRLSLNRTQLKLIAIVSMVIDHTAWGFVDFYSPLGQFLHVCGRLTVPIMCFFIAEGFRKTSDLRRYIFRMLTFAAISTIPFYVFFHEEYDYRQNIIFDLSLGLLLLTVLESKRLPKYAKVLLAAAIFGTSATIGGWVITPLLFILSFYYGRSFREKAKWFALADVGTVVFLMISIALNNVYHFAKYEWLWWDKSYLLGFLLALPLLYCYNGEKGSNLGGRYFFYVFYPAHFLLLSAIRALVTGSASTHEIYLTVHIVGLLTVLVVTFLTIIAKTSKGQNSILMIEFGAMIYIAGFILEILSDTVEGVHFACLVQYFGEYILFIAMLYFVSILCSRRIPMFVYLYLTMCSLAFLYLLMTTRETGLFYREIAVDFSGPFSRPLLTYGIGFFVSIGYIALTSGAACVLCILKYRSGNTLEKKRLKFVMLAVVCCWLPYGLKLLGLTGGYEIPALGIAAAAFFMYLCLLQYGFLDSVTLASLNALDRGREGILVVDTEYHLEYQNRRIEDVFGLLPEGTDLRENEKLRGVLTGERETLEMRGKIYDFVSEPLMEGNFERGHMLWMIDSTEHYRTMRKIQEMAIRDALTGLYNRIELQRLVEQELAKGIGGTLAMIDLDNFKQVNDRNGHQCGDAVLVAVAETLSGFPEEAIYSGRIGGDEFCAFLRGEEDPERIAERLRKMMTGFENRLSVLGYAGITSLSIGAARAGEIPDADFKDLYTAADKALYEAKTAGKKRFVIR